MDDRVDEWVGCQTLASATGRLSAMREQLPIRVCGGKPDGAAIGWLQRNSGRSNEGQESWSWLKAASVASRRRQCFLCQSGGHDGFQRVLVGQTPRTPVKGSP